MADEKKKDDPIALLKENYSKVKKIIATTQAAHSEAYLNAQKAHLTGKDGLIDPELLDKVDVQKKFLDTMIEHYMTKAMKDLNLKGKPADAIRQDQILKAYAGITRGELKNMIQTQGKDYTLNQHEHIRDGLIDEIRKELSKSAQGHIGKEHTGALIKSMGLDDIVDTSKMTHQDALTMYNLQESRGGDKLTQKSIASYYKSQGQASPVFIKEEKKDKAYKK